VTLAAPSAENAEFVVIQTHLSRGLRSKSMTTKDFTRAPHRAAAAVSAMRRRLSAKRFLGNGDFGHLEGDVATCD